MATVPIRRKSLFYNYGMTIERTLSIIKPDAVKKNAIGRILARFEAAGLRIVAARMMHLSRAEAEGFYAVHRSRAFFRDLVEFMTSGPVLVQVLEGEDAIAKNRELMGATDPKKAAKGTIRADFADSIDANAVHGSDAPETARTEVAYFFPACEVFSRVKANLLGLRRRGAAALFPGAGREAVPRPPGDALDPPARRGRLRGHERPREGDCARSSPPRPASRRRRSSAIPLAADGTRKWLLKVDGANAVEAVFIPEASRGTLCVSSQAGCVLDCAFCSTGKQGFNRNLTSAEIVGQLWLANRLIDSERTVSNVVMMGMGEPLLNLDNVLPALRLMLDDNAYGLSRRRVTVSTSGVVPGMDRLRDECPVALAVSLHAPNDALRDRLVPVNRKYPLRELLAACNRYLEKAPRDFITFEYVMLEGVNDGDARGARARRDRGARALQVQPDSRSIRFRDSEFRRSSPERIRRFAEILQSAGVTVTTRKTRGDDIAAACGQLAGDVADRTRRTRLSLKEMHP